MSRIAPPSDPTPSADRPTSGPSDVDALAPSEHVPDDPTATGNPSGAQVSAARPHFKGRGFTPMHRGTPRLTSRTELDGVIEALQHCGNPGNALASQTRQLAALVSALHQLANSPFGDDRERASLDPSPPEISPDEKKPPP